MAIHPTAIIAEGSEIHHTAEIGPYCIIGSHARIGANTKLISHVNVQNRTTIGENNTVFPFASLGTVPQDLKFDGEPSTLQIGNNNTIRESVTMNIGTQDGAMETRVGNDCLFMAYSHVAHDCELGNQVILANSVGLAGHVSLGDNVIVGGLAGIHQFCRVGTMALVAAGAMVAQDVLPFCMVQGDRARHVSVNRIGLQRQGLSKTAITQLSSAFKILFHSGKTRALALETIRTGFDDPHVETFVEFMKSSSRSICSIRRNQG
ncbi:MAG: acyl-ACP--UDP-N-acetylglucosamine O-acyltransferase [Myxococcota bacterium]|nr:acyl-ACP--UDP-N-acetylglucosamine O-acyltransferase [Myxococcota bacterium]